MWPPNLLPPIGFLSLATYISNYSDGRKEGRSVPELGMEAKGCQLWFTSYI